jgi:hypothetical protein
MDDRFKKLVSATRKRKPTVDSRGRFLATEEDEEEEEQEEGEEVEEDEEEGTLGEGNESSEAVEEIELDPEELARLENDAANWSGSEISHCDATHRIAVVNCDWDHIQLEDLFSVFFHNLPVGGKLLSVKLYLSNFGKEQIEYERMHGPNLWVKKGEEGYEEAVLENERLLAQKQEAAKAYLEEFGEEAMADFDDYWDDDDVSMLKHRTDNVDGKRTSSDSNPNGETVENRKGGELFSSGKYRQYELNRMKYYYAIAEFDCTESARVVYNTCDGVDVEASGVTLDLRYVPEEENFEDEPVKVVTKIPKGFRPVKGFKSAALTQTRFQISWDQDDFSRTQKVQDSFTGEAAEDDLAAYIASSDSEDEEGGKLTKEAIRKKYAALLKGVVDLDGSGGDNAAGDADADEENEDDDQAGEEEDEDASSNDDDLNRFSDVELDENADSQDEEERGGNLEATFDMDEDDKAARLQRDVKRKLELSQADLATKDAIKNRMKRKEKKKSKKEMLKEQKEQEKAADAEEKEEHRRALKAALGDSAIDVEPKKANRLVRKERAKQLKLAEKQQKDQLKRSRLLQSQGVDPNKAPSAPAKSASSPHGGEQPAAVVDPRFDRRLITDPRFHLDIAAKPSAAKGKRDEGLQRAALAVATARRKQTQQGSTSGSSSTAASTKGDRKTTRDSAESQAPLSDAVDEVQYFLNRPSKKPRTQ